MEIGDVCPPCNCQVGACQSGIEPFGDCVRQLKGTTIWHKCETCGMFAWNNNGTCINCARVARDERKETQRKRFEGIKEQAPVTDENSAQPAMARHDDVVTDPEPKMIGRLTLQLYGQTIIWDDPAVVMSFVAYALGGVKK